MKRARGTAQVVESLLSKCEALRAQSLALPPSKKIMKNYLKNKSTKRMGVWTRSCVQTPVL
jgi:hypothetical protein